MSITEETTQPFIDITLVNQSTVIPLESPWTASMTFLLNLRNSETPVTFSRDDFTILPSREADHASREVLREGKWSIVEQGGDHEIRCPMLFPDPVSGFEISGKDIGLFPNKSTEVVLWPFDSMDAESYMPDLSKFEKDRPYSLRLNVSHIRSYTQDSAFRTRLNRIKAPGSQTHPHNNPAIRFRIQEPWTLTFSESSTSPWLEVQAFPASSTLDLTSPGGFSINLTMKLRDCKSPIVIPSYSGVWDAPTSLQQIGGKLIYTNEKTGGTLPLRPPQTFISRALTRRSIKGLLWLLNHCCTLYPNQSISIHQILFEEDKTEYSTEAEQFQEGRTYHVRLEHRFGIREWFEGTVAGNLLWRVLNGYWSSEAPLEKGCIPFFQTNAGSFTVIRT